MKQLLFATLLIFFIVGCKEDIKVKPENNVTVKQEQNKTVVKVKKKVRESIVEKLEPIEEIEEQQVIYSDNLQNDPSGLRSALELYLEQLRTLNTEGIVDMTYPKLFIPINKTMFKRYIETLLNSEQIAIESFHTDILDIDEVQEYENGEFAFVRYKSSIQLNFVDPTLYSDDLSVRVLSDVLKSKYGDENIDIDPQNRTIRIDKEEKLLAIREKDGEWKFIGDNSEYRRLYPDILPSEILSRI